ncbi:MAG: hypothetical protein IPJ41_05095 [Phycisphaerales bacterium]|nr:hypothetical protein [Phycisphaerales bacterium]
MSDNEPPRRGPLTRLHGMVSEYLAVRPASALATDAIVLMVLAVAAEHVWSAVFDAIPPEVRVRGSASLLAALVRPVGLARAVSALLQALAWMLGGWAGVRLLAGSLSGARGAGGR